MRSSVGLERDCEPPYPSINIFKTLISGPTTTRKRRAVGRIAFEEEVDKEVDKEVDASFRGIDSSKSGPVSIAGEVKSKRRVALILA